MVENNKQEPVISVGNLDAIRDFLDVRDVARACWLSLEKGEPGQIYNICSGKGYLIKDLLNKLLSLSSVSINVRKDPKRLRPSDIPIIIGNPSKFAKQTGWTSRAINGTCSFVNVQVTIFN